MNTDTYFQALVIIGVIYAMGHCLAYLVRELDGFTLHLFPRARQNRVLWVARDWRPPDNRSLLLLLCVDVPTAALVAFLTADWLPVVISVLLMALGRYLVNVSKKDFFAHLFLPLKSTVGSLLICVAYTYCLAYPISLQLLEIRGR